MSSFFLNKIKKRKTSTPFFCFSLLFVDPQQKKTTKKKTVKSTENKKKAFLVLFFVSLFLLLLHFFLFFFFFKEQTKKTKKGNLPYLLKQSKTIPFFCLNSFVVLIVSHILKTKKE